MVCINVMAVMFCGYRVGIWLMSDQVEISCGAPKQGAAYCAYHRTTPGFLQTSYEVLIGPSPGRGLVYGVPYAVEQTSATWDSATGAVTIAMPGTTLTITPAEYLDTR